ncbi:MAG: hypothetical protein IKT52_02455 [Oscillospiraceae bacterium]|nr:hypothetical protein [Oscillospiraceae bacterium]
MKEKRIFYALGSVNDQFVEEMYAPDEIKNKRLPAKKVWLIAAIIGTMVFLMGCAAWIVLRMQDMKLGEETLYYDVFSDEGFVGREPVEMEVLTFAGVKGSPSYQAAKEWFDFLKAYDPESKIYHSVYKNLPNFPEEYSSYNLYTQEMKDALDSILQKYSLKPVGSLLNFKSVENVCAALEIEKFTIDGNGVQTNITGGYPFDNGNFMLNVDIKLPDDTASQVCRTQGQIDWYRKDCLSQDHIYLEELAQWKEWNYKTAAGNEVLIIRSDSDWRAWIICERVEAMLVLRLESRIDLGYNEDCSKHWGYLEMTDEQLEMVADTIDFGIQPRIATKEDVANQKNLPYEHPTDFYETEIVKNPEETLEFVTEPITFKTIGGYVEDAEENREYLYESWTVTSFTLGSNSATIIGCPVFSTPDEQLTVYMKDGSSVLLYGKATGNGACQLTASSEIDLAQVDYILLQDGAKLFAP